MQKPIRQVIQIFISWFRQCYSKSCIFCAVMNIYRHSSLFTALLQQRDIHDVVSKLLCIGLDKKLWKKLHDHFISHNMQWTVSFVRITSYWEPNVRTRGHCLCIFQKCYFFSMGLFGVLRFEGGKLRSIFIIKSVIPVTTFLLNTIP